MQSNVHVEQKYANYMVTSLSFDVYTDVTAIVWYVMDTLAITHDKCATVKCTGQ